MMCRESLIAFVKEAAEVITLPENSPKPKASDFSGWIDVITNTIAGGQSAERRRGYMKAIAKSTWELAQWLTHSENAIRFDAYFAFKATEHVLTVYSLALIRFQSGSPNRCPTCASYRLASDYRRSDDNTTQHVTICEACGWEDDPIVFEEEQGADDEAEQMSAKAKEDIGDCILVEVPLRGPKPPKPSR